MAITLGTDGYCEAADVQARFGQQTFASGSVPTTTQVEGFITDGFNIINGILAAVGYSTPVETSATKASRVLLRMNADYAASEAHLAAFSAGVGGVPEQAEFLEGRFNKMVTRLEKGHLSLEDATTTSDLIKLHSDQDPEGKFNLDSNGDENDPVFTRATNF